ncbi:MAG: ribulose-phosphate 3-epimerase [Rhodothermales bacterium]
MATLAPSILSADFNRLEAHVREAIACDIDWLHLDVMDGHFVPNITIGPLVVRALRKVKEETGVTLDCHLMIEEPERYVEDFVEAGADSVTVHVEAATHLHRVVQQIHSAGARAGVALNPATSLDSIEEILPYVDLVLVMTVNPGFGGQKYIPTSTDKIRRLRQTIDRRGLKVDLQIDGGVNEHTIREAVDAGANVIVSGNSVFGGSRSVADNITALRSALLKIA